MALSDSLDLLGYLRYGRSSADKEAAARGRILPGAPVDTSEDQEAADRYASGYLFTQEHPILSQATMPMVNRIRTGLFGDSPELQSYANAGMNQALIQAGALERGRRQPPSPTPMPAPPPGRFPY